MLYLMLIAGFALLFFGGEFLVRGAVGVATRLGVSTLVIGLTLVGFGTSTPELVASLLAALDGLPGVAVGNVVGSNIANVLLILGLAALIQPFACHRGAFLRDGPVLLGATALLIAIGVSGTIGRLVAAAFLVLLAAYLLFVYRSERAAADASAAMHRAKAEELPPMMSLPRGLALAAGGIVAVVLGARLLVDSAVMLARHVGISEAVIGLTVVAVGTSLPELATSVMAAWRRHGDVAFGNVVGSNIFNILGICGVTALVQPLAVPPEIMRLDLWVMGATALLLIAFTITQWRVTRGEGAVFLLAYGAYLAWLFA